MGAQSSSAQPKKSESKGRGYNNSVKSDDKSVSSEEQENKATCVKRDDESAKTKLAWLMLSGLGGAEKDENRAVFLLKEKVKKNDGDAMWMLGVCYEFGIGIEQNIKRAGVLYKQSYEKGNDIGKFFVLLLVETGIGKMNMHSL